MISRAERIQNKQSFTQLIVLKCENLSSGHLEVSLAIDIKKVVVKRVWAFSLANCGFKFK